jgi:putative addiction module component (TIGR02574 family)
MTTDAKRLLDDALQLAEAERAEIAGRLIESLDDQIDADAQERWSDEIAQRLADLDSGAVKAIPWAEVRRRMTPDAK